jgi:prepilin-type N-terminal cleavage/methylation domain-containing protein
MSARHGAQDEQGFTLVEVLVATLIIVIGLFGTLAMLDGANATTTSTKAREQGVALQREIIEAARSIPYDQLTPTSIVSRVQAMPNLGDSNLSQPGWTIVRRGVTYTATLGVCSVDDPADGTGASDPATTCAPGSATSAQCDQWLGVNGSVQGTAGAVAAAAAAHLGVGQCGIDLNLDGTVDQLVQADVNLSLCLQGLLNLFFCPANNGDTNPDDYKRIVSLVRWDRGSGSRYALQVTTVPNPGSSAAPAVTSVTNNAGFPNPGASSARFTATTNRAPNTVAWYVDGTPKSTPGNSGGSGTSWTFDWPIGSPSGGSSAQPSSGEVLDGSYVISAKAFDAYGQFGATRAQTITLNRRQPYAPQGFAAGINGSETDFEWAPNKERDIVGYHVYQRTLLGQTTQVCNTVQTSCAYPQTNAGASYWVVAVDKDTSGNLREGDQSSSVTTTALNTRPNPPTNLQLSSANGVTTLTWTASTGDPDLGDDVAYYRIYRDGTAFANRYDRTGDKTTLTWTDTNTSATTHTYYVTAVDKHLAESTFAGPRTG